MPNPIETYEVCCHNLKVDDQSLQPGDTVELDINTAQPLLDCKPPAIKLPEGAEKNNVVNINPAPDQNNPNRKNKPEDKAQVDLLIEQTIKGMEKNDTNFTDGGKGKPDAKALTNLLGWGVSAKERDAVWEAMQAGVE